MSLYFITGKIGSGKSYRGMVNIRDEILNGSRLIVTNLPIKLPEFSDYLAEHYPAKEVCLYDHWRNAHAGECLAGAVELAPVSFAPGVVGKLVDGAPMVFVPSRIRILSDVELKEFYRFRQVGAGLVAKINEREGGDKGPSNPVCLDFAPWGKRGQFGGQGVVYHLDECQLFYNVRKYAEAPEEMPFYLSQHRKLGDDVYCYTQKPENVDKMLRSFTQEYIYLTNIGKKKIGIFQPPKFFRMSAYPDVFTGAPGQVSEWSRSFRMDFRLAECYDTASGIGIEAAKADKEAAVRGISWKWALLLPVLLASAFPLYSMLSKHLVHGVLGGPVAALSAASHPSNRLEGGSGGRAVAESPLIGAAGPGVASALTAEKRMVVDNPGRRAVSPGFDPAAVAGAVYQASRLVPAVSHDVFFVGLTISPNQNGVVLKVVTLSDGKQYVLGVDRELTVLTDKYCVVAGVLYAWKSAEDLSRDAVAERRQPNSGAGYPSFDRTATPPGQMRSGGVIVGGSPRQQ